MDLIKKWLSGSQNYHVGVVLYKKFGTDDKLKSLFDNKPDKYLIERLQEELSSLLAKPAVILQSPVKKGYADEMPLSPDPVLKAFHAEWTPLYQRMNYLRHELDKYQGNSQEAIAGRGKIAFEVLELEQQCMEIWSRRDHYLQTGNLPSAKTKNKPLPKDPIDIGKKIESLKKNIRRNKQLAKKHPDNPNYPLRARNYEAELESIIKQQGDAKA
jgi:hypothetical protein